MKIVNCLFEIEHLILKEQTMTNAQFSMNNSTCSRSHPASVFYFYLWYFNGFTIYFYIFQFISEFLVYCSLLTVYRVFILCTLYFILCTLYFVLCTLYFCSLFFTKYEFYECTNKILFIPAHARILRVIVNLASCPL